MDESDHFGVSGPGSAGSPLNPGAERLDYLIDVARQVVDALDPPDLRGAFLFGSAVWGDADEASDLDIMLLQDRPTGYRKVVRARVADVLRRAAAARTALRGPRLRLGCGSQGVAGHGNLERPPQARRHPAR